MKKIKKAISLLLAVLMISSMFFCAGVTGFAADSDILEYLTYEINDGEVIITDCDSSISGEVVIPDTIEGYPVTAIGSYAFSWCKEITKVKIPSGVKVLQNDAFLGCSALYDIILPENPINMESSVFENTAYYNDEANWSNGLLYLDYYLLAANTSECIVKPGIRIIAKNAFSYNYLIKSIEIPASVEYIYDTFCYSENLNHISVDSANANYTTEQGVLFNKDKTVLIKYPPANVNTVYTIPDSVITISDSAFSSAAYLENIIIPDGVVTIEKNVFEASNIKSISISASVETIGESSFLSCHELEKITIDENNAYYSSDENGVLFNKNKTVLIQYPLGNKISEYSIPDTVKTIGYCSFSHCKCLETVIIPDSVTEIEAMAFSMYDSGSYMLKNIVMGKNVAIIGAEAFSFNFKIEKIELSESVTTIESGALSYCRNLKNVSIPESIAIIENGVFNGCENLTDVYYAGSEAQWNTIYIDNGLNDPLFEATIHYSDDETDTEIINYFTYEIFDGEVIITGCDSSISGDIVIPDTIEGYPVTAIGDEAFWNCYMVKSIEIPNSVKTIGRNAFSFCYELESIIIPDGVSAIDDFAFNSCEKLENISIPSSVKTIGKSAFVYCYNLSGFVVDENNKQYTNDAYGVLFNKDKTMLIQYPIGNKLSEYTIPEGVINIVDWAFAASEIANVIIPDSVVTIGEQAFAYCKSLTSIKIPVGVETIGQNAFEICSVLSNITVDEQNSNYSSDNYGVLFNKDKTMLVQYPIGNSRNSYNIPDSVTLINDYAFYKSSNLAEVSIPEGVVTIDFAAFSGCENLTDIKLPDSLIEIGGYAFESCTSLTDIKIPNGVTTLDNCAFIGCKNLKEVVISDSVTELNYNVFSVCKSLQKVFAPGVEFVGSDVFSYCTSLDMFVTFADNVTIEAGSFSGSENLIIFVNKTADLSISDNYNVVSCNLSDGVLSFSGNYKSDLYYLFDLVAVMCTYYDGIDYLFFDSFEAVSADDGHIYYYTDNWERKVFDGTRVRNVRFRVDAFDSTGEMRQFSFNELCDAVMSGEVTNFYLIIEEADGFDNGDVEITLVEQIRQVVARVLKAIVNLLNKLFSIFK